MKEVLLIALYALIFSVRSSATVPITGVDSLCVGATTTLSDTDPGGVWSSSIPSVATIGTDGIVSGLMAGTSTISYNVGGSIAIMIVTVKPSPSVTISASAGDTICWGTLDTFTATVTGFSGSAPFMDNWYIWGPM